jgi:hypothetical protein
MNTSRAMAVDSSIIPMSRTRLAEGLNLAALVCLLNSAQLLNAQGTLNYTLRIPSLIAAHVYGPEAGNPTVTKLGNTASETPAGTQTYTGILLEGSGWSAQLFAANGSGLPESSLSPIATSVTTFRTGTTLVGTIAPSVQTIPNVGFFETGTFQLRAWDNVGGILTDWVAAEPLWLNGTIAAGKSILFDINFPNPSAPPADMVNFRSFNTHMIPEPGTWTLLFVGGIAFLARRCGRRCLSKSP